MATNVPQLNMYTAELVSPRQNLMTLFAAEIESRRAWFISYIAARIFTRVFRAKVLDQKTPDGKEIVSFNDQIHRLP